MSHYSTHALAYASSRTTALQVGALWRDGHFCGLLEQRLFFAYFACQCALAVNECMPFFSASLPLRRVSGVAYFDSSFILQVLGSSAVGPDILGAVIRAAAFSPRKFNVHAWME